MYTPEIKLTREKGGAVVYSQGPQIVNTLIGTHEELAALSLASLAVGGGQTDKALSQKLGPEQEFTFSLSRVGNFPYFRQALDHVLRSLGQRCVHYSFPRYSPRRSRN